MRILGLDVLRGIAVILVLFRHSDLNGNVLHHFGWLGVDLFFVLSGFLISNILFLEFKKCGKINIQRFFIRRSFKIFPPFYFFLLSTVSVYYLFNIEEIFTKKLLSEIFYLQSYLPRMWIHTWSLSVEEHFYILFSFCLIFLVKKKILERRSKMIISLVFLICLSFCLRFIESYPYRDEAYHSFMQSHLRFDGILMGILLSYLYNFSEFTSILMKRKYVTLLISVLLIFPGFIYEGGSFFMNTIGLTIVNLGFTLQVLLFLDLRSLMPKSFYRFTRLLYSALAFVGINSYSIYLWHLNSKDFIYHQFNLSDIELTVLYFSIAVIMGVFMSYLIEKSSLKLRDQLYNSNIKFYKKPK